MLNPHSVPPVTLRKVAAAAAVGNFVEWFDFAVYGFLATVIAAQFFRRVCRRRRCCKPCRFAVAFALRPLGGVVFGMLGDKFGRKRILSVTVLLMAASTTVIGLLPDYHQIGVAARCC